MEERAKPAISIDLAQFKLHIRFTSRTEVTLLFDSPSRRFYLSVMALVLNEMKRLGKITSVALEAHADQLDLLNGTVGGSLGSSENLIPRIYRKWKDALPDLENAPLFKVVGRKKEDDGTGRTYRFSEAEKDAWANLFEYKGSDEHVRLRFSIDKLGASLDDATILYEDARDHHAWQRFIASLKEKPEGRAQAVPAPAPQEPSPATPTAAQENVVKPRRYRNVVFIMSLAVAVGIIAFMLRHAFAPARAGNLASIEKMAFPLPDVPSIVVLPFVNMSEDPKQEFFCDGITQSIITALLKVPGLFVISPPTTFSYKGKQVKVKQVSEELGVRYVLEGSVQRSADRIRINAHLIDALTGRPIWAERYDGDLKDLFALQDEITMKILTATQVKLTEGEQAVTVATYYKGKQGLDCYLKYYEGTGYLRRGTIQDDNVARRIGDEVIAMCPQNPMGYFLLGLVHLQEYRLSNTKSPRETLEKGIELAQKMLALDDSIAAGHALLSYFYSMKGEHEKAIAEGERAVSLNPGAALANGAYANSLYHAGRPGEAIPFFQKAARLCPVTGSTLHVPIGNALMHTERFEEAVSEYKKAIRLSPDNILAHVGLAGTYSMMSQEKEAHAEATEVLRINPKFSVDYFAKTLSYKDQSKKDKTISALRKAGLK